MSSAFALHSPLPSGFSLRNAIHAVHLIDRAYDLYQQWSDAGKPPRAQMEFQPLVYGKLVFSEPFWRRLVYTRRIRTNPHSSRTRRIVENTPAGICAVRGRQLFVIFRGTQSQGEKIANGMALRQDAVFDDLEGGGVHRGFHRCYESVRPAILEFLHRHAAPDRSIRVVGHSLGGALAVLAAMEFATGGLPFRRLESFTFAAPLVGSRKWARHFARQPIRAWRIANRRDFITKIPPAFLGFRHVGTPLHFTSPKGLPPHSLDDAYLPALRRSIPKHHTRH